MLNKIIDSVGEWNPQFFREAKGRLKTRNILTATIIAVLGQIIFYSYSAMQLPNAGDCYGRYCVKGYLEINWALWWLDSFIGISAIAIFILLLGGVYMLMADLSQEEKNGTLEFVRLSPQSATEILLGKVLGVPILLYWMAILVLPLHLWAGLNAHIPIPLIFSFYGVMAVSCFFFYSLALLYGLLSYTSGGFQAWVGSGAIFFYLWICSGLTFSTNAHWENPLDWLRLFYPGTILPYLVKATGILKVGYLPIKELTSLRWYELPLWQHAWLGIGLFILHLGVLSFWIWQGLKRRFYDINGTVLSKNQSYWFSTVTMGIIFGFSLQTDNTRFLYNNFLGVLCFHLLLMLGLIFALTPQRQTIQDWARYRHQQANRSLLKDLIFGEKSPAVLAIAINCLITAVIMLPGILLLFGEYKIPAIVSLFCQGSILTIYALVTQLILLRRNKRREVWAKLIITMMMFLPLISLGMLRLFPHEHASLWLFSALPIVAAEHAVMSQILFSVLGQWLTIALGSFILTKQLQKMGESESKALSSGWRIS